MASHSLRSAGSYFATSFASTTAHTINEDMLAQTDMGQGISMNGTLKAPDGKEFTIKF